MGIISISGKINSGKDTVGKIIQGLVIGEKEFINGIEGFLNTYEDYLSYPNKEWEIKKFAYKLKEIVALLTGCTVEDLESQDFKNSYLGKEWEFYYNGIPIKPMAVTPDALEALGEDRIHCYNYRTLLQKIGTDAMRDNIHENIWVNALFADYKQPAKVAIEKTGGYCNSETPFEYPNWIITDTRFPNELKAIKDRGGISIRVNRNKYFYLDQECTLEELCETIKQETGEYPLYSYCDEHYLIKGSDHPSETALDDANFKYVIDNSGSIEDLIEKVKEILIKEKLL